MASADGPRLTDVEGRSYIDFCQSFGPLILGHRHPAVAAAAHAAIDDGWTYGTCEPYSLALAEWIIARVPWVERIRFVSSGTEAVMSALRVARAATGRAVTLKFEGCYHGHADTMLVRAGSGLATGMGTVAATSAGLTDELVAHTLVAPLDNELALENIFARSGDRLAAVILEAVPANYGLLPQRAEWLRRLEQLCRASGTLLIVDEVITGFRLGLTGASGRYGLTPDLVCYGKIIGGGFPVGAYAGRADLLALVAPEGPVYQAGTLSANPVGMRAGLATLQYMEDHDGWSALDQRTAAFVERLQRELAPLSSSSPPCSIAREASIFWMSWHGHRTGTVRRPDAIDLSESVYAAFFQAALRHGVYLPPSPYEVCFVSLAHDDTTLDAAAVALVEAGREVLSQ
jgi:glutamate-1-semialdehyde 2,1-aminomutase